MNTRIFDVANYLISRCNKITNMKLQKLVFYSHVQFLIANKKPLVNSTIEAWIYGPVIPDLYREFSKYSYNAIRKITDKGDENKLTTEHKDTIDYILKIYGNKTASELSDKTHAEDPWQDAYQSTDWSENIITNEAITQYYTSHPLS